MIKLVVSDLDGTLLNHHGQISQRNRQAIEKLKEHGVEFAIASGRDCSSIQSVMESVPVRYDAILGNGAQYMDYQGNILMERYLDKHIYKDIVAVFEKENISYMVFTTQGVYALDPKLVHEKFMERSHLRFGTQPKDFLEGGSHANASSRFLKPIENVQDFLNQDMDIIKVEAFSLCAKDIDIAKEQLKNIKGISFLSSFDDNVEVTHQDAQKGFILEKVALLKNLNKEEIAVLGDGMNDLTLFQKFFYSFAPQNAHPHIKNLAYCVVDDCDHDGFSEAIDQILMIS